eukprot:Blabericola_migrator_1__205@NODE_1054_length_5578_cov_25_802395_g596_i1_p1_GENE_NODE_1054_length_5578_cov_25_802395_g596_i1NODE_1054_length_5578_cov_25_802395_g596_i1_p1_ORF_typecomplete_len512_score75_98_NODE_1054_length_5578_cov_25_802395_g596_i122453780
MDRLSFGGTITSSEDGAIDDSSQSRQYRPVKGLSPRSTMALPVKPFEYHRGVDQLSELSHSVNVYFEALNLEPFREFFPATEAQQYSILKELCSGFTKRMGRNKSLAKGAQLDPLTYDPVHYMRAPHITVSQSSSLTAIKLPLENLTPQPLLHEKQRLHMPRDLLEKASTVDIRTILLRGSQNVRGFLHCMCLNHIVKAASTPIYTPILGGWIAVSADDNYTDREIKGVFSWRGGVASVEKELQYAFFIRLLIDACWWQVDEDAVSRDNTTDGNRFVSILMDDLALFPIGTFSIIDELGDVVATQHYDVEGVSIRHSLANCACSRFRDSPEPKRSHILIPAYRLKSHLTEVFNSRKRSTADPILRAVTNGIPSSGVVAYIMGLRERVAAHLTQPSEPTRKRVVESAFGDDPTLSAGPVKRTKWNNGLTAENEAPTLPRIHRHDAVSPLQTPVYLTDGVVSSSSVQEEDDIDYSSAPVSDSEPGVINIESDSDERGHKGYEDTIVDTMTVDI